MRYKLRSFQILYLPVSLAAVPLGCHATRIFSDMMFQSYIVEEARKKKLPFTLGDGTLFCL